MFAGPDHRGDRRSLDPADPARLFSAHRRFEGFQSALGITRHLLADRLKKLVRQGVLRRIPYQESPKRHEYILTQKGLDLYPIMMSIVHWGDIHMVDERGRPLLHEHKTCGKIFDPVMICSECGEPLTPRKCTPIRAPARVRVRRGVLPRPRQRRASRRPDASRGRPRHGRIVAGKRRRNSIFGSCRFRRRRALRRTRRRRASTILGVRVFS